MAKAPKLRTTSFPFQLWFSNVAYAELSGVVVLQLFQTRYESGRSVLNDMPGQLIKPKRIYNPITAMGFSAMFTFQLGNTKR